MASATSNPHAEWSTSCSHRDATDCLARLRVATGIVLAMAIVSARAIPAIAAENFLNRDGAVRSAYPYGYSDGGEYYPHEEAGAWELPGPFSLLSSEPSLQTLVLGPTFRNE